MNQRTAEMAQLLNKEKGEHDIAGLAQYFQVSQRTIRNDLKEINTTLQQNGFEGVSLQSGGKLKLPDTFEKALPFFIAGDFYSYKLSKDERKRVAAAMIVNSAEYITLAAIAENLFVSRATIINDLKDIKAFVQEENLEVLSHANKGLRAAGAESDKRAFLLKLLRPSEFENEQSVISRHVSVQAGDRVIIQKILSEQEHKYKRFLDDSSFREILLYLSIMVGRNLAGEFLEPQPEGSSDKYLLAQDTLRYISQYCGVITTEDDIRYLSKILENVRYMRHSVFGKNTVKIQMITRQFIASISVELGVNLNTDYDFFENLSNHLESVFSAPPISYPKLEVIEEILEDSQDVVEAVRNQLPVLCQYMGRMLNEMEINYIAVHVCAAIERKKNKEVAFHVIVACHAGIGTSRLLLEKLKQHFKFQIVDVISAHDAKNIDQASADFVISTVPLKECPIDYIVVSVAFSDEDYVRVGNKIDILRNSRNLPSRVQEDKISAKGVIEKIKPVVYETVPEEAPALMKKLRGVIRDYFNQSAEAEAEIFSPYLHHLLPQSNIELDVECTDWKDAVRRSAAKLLERGYIEARYIDAMIANIEENGPYVVLSPGFAMPHEGLEQGSIRLGMYLIRLKTPVDFGDEEMDPVEFVCCLSAIDHKTHLKAFFNLVNMLKNAEFKKMLQECRTPEEAAGVIEKYEYSILG